MTVGWWRRKRWLLTSPVASILLVVAVLELAPPRTVDVNWDYDYVHDPPCTSRSPDNCVTGFRVFVGDPHDRSQQVFVANPDEIGRNPAHQRLGTFLKVDRSGYLQFCVLAVKTGQSRSTTVESAPICTRRLVLPFGIGSNWMR